MSNSANIFVSAYNGAYLPDSAKGPNLGFDSNWLGDAGFTGNPFPGDVSYFQVVEPAYSNLVLVVGNTGAANAGVGDAFQITVEGFLGSQFTDVPEPSSIILCGGGTALTAFVYRLLRGGIILITVMRRW